MISAARYWQLLIELALDLRWSFNHRTDAIWEQLDPALWKLTHNPWVILQTVSRGRLASIRRSQRFRRLVNTLVQDRQVADRMPRWYEEFHPERPLGAVAHFSMEFMLSEALPIYSGGLGNVAGDLLKTADDLGIPIIGIGLLYQQGYFRQDVGGDGRQRSLYPFNDPGQLPITPVRDVSGEWVRFPIAFPGATVWVRAWQVQIGRVRLYLMDTNDPANTPANRGIAGELYGGDDELRLKQEIVLGIGGWRMLHAIGIQADVCHLNEGHAAFAVLERARSHMAQQRQNFDLALTVTRAGNVFTTHTPVDAGFDRFAPDLVAKYLRFYAEHDLAIGLDALLALGRRDARDEAEPFNMAYLALRGSGRVNGVSRLHGEVSRRIFQPLFPRWPEVEVPVSHVTNGVHMPTWDSDEADRLWETSHGKDRWRRDHGTVGRHLHALGDAAIWEFRTRARTALVGYIREHLTRQLADQSAPQADIAAAGRIFDPDVLTVGFARRFATYKRPNLLLHDPERLARILDNRERPLQLVVAGKAHPHDAAGQTLIEQWLRFMHRADVRHRVVFLSDYDMLVAERLVQGVDVWINTPRRPWEACGTSGMKVLVNGGLNLSELDGWWAEAYRPEVGWAIGDQQDHGDDPAWDAAEADALYALLEGDVASAFYTRDEHGIPGAWVARVRESMAHLTPPFSSSRMVRHYLDAYYLPAAAAYRHRAASGARWGAAILEWRERLARHWPAVRVAGCDVCSRERDHVFRVRVNLGDLSPSDVSVELYADAADGRAAASQLMAQVERAGDLWVFSAAVSASRPSSDFTPRVIPAHAGASIPLEAPFIAWGEASTAR
jgi:starch phosphorylase